MRVFKSVPTIHKLPISFETNLILIVLFQHTSRVGPSVGNKEMLLQMLRYVIERFYPHILVEEGEEEERIVALYRGIMEKTAVLVASWQAVSHTIIQ